jgi:truncated hemoglobin YjbI
VGGAGAVEALVEGMYSKIFNDPDLEGFFKKTNRDH